MTISELFLTDTPSTLIATKSKTNLKMVKRTKITTL